MPVVPHSGQSMLGSIWSVLILCLSIVCVVESFCLRREGKSEGLLLVTMVLDAVSICF